MIASHAFKDTSPLGGKLSAGASGFRSIEASVAHFTWYFFPHRDAGKGRGSLCLELPQEPRTLSRYEHSGDAQGHSQCYRYSRERADKGGCSQAGEGAARPVASTPAGPESSSALLGPAAATAGPCLDQCPRVSAEMLPRRS